MHYSKIVWIIYISKICIPPRPWWLCSDVYPTRKVCPKLSSPTSPVGCLMQHWTTFLQDFSNALVTSCSTITANFFNVYGIHLHLLHLCIHLHGLAPLVFFLFCWGNLVDEQAVQFPLQRSNLYILFNNVGTRESKSTVTTLRFRPTGCTIPPIALQTTWCFSSKAQQVCTAGVVKDLQFN